MPTVTAIALETLLEPGSFPSPASPTAHHHALHHRRNSASDPPPSAPKDHLTRRNSTGGASTSPREHHHHHHHHHHGGRREQQPVFLSRRPREASSVAGASANDSSRAPQAVGSRAKPSVHGYYISPKLYVTPEPTQIVPTGGVSSSSSSPNSVTSPSPYVVNYKRRDVPRPPHPPPLTVIAAASNGHGALSSPAEMRSHPNGFDYTTKPLDCGAEDTTGRGLTNGQLGVCFYGPSDEVAGRGGRGREGIRKVGEEDEDSSFDFNFNNKNDLPKKEHPDGGVDDDEEDDFFDPRELMSAVSNSDTEEGSSFRGGSARCHTPLASQSEFYDATEDFFSDNSVSLSSPSSRANIQADLCSIRLNLFEEIERRKKAEEAMDHMQNMFQRIARQLPQRGMSFPPIQRGGSMWYDVDSAAQFCQEVVVLRIVSAALERDLARAETEAAAEAIIDVKNHEIARLRDRLQYYEAMNQEMSQRNQEAIEFARRRRLKRKMKRKWIWGCIGLSVTVGASLMSYSYLTHGGEKPSLSSSVSDQGPPGAIASSD